MNTKEEHTSPLYERTHKAICNALIELLIDKPFEKITVQDILDATPVTRTTFYHHFHDKYEVAEYLQQQFIAIQRSLRQDLETVDSTYAISSIISKHSKHTTDMALALSKIHTETVNLREISMMYNRNIYAAKRDQSADSLPANIYANALAAFGDYTLTLQVQKQDLRIAYNEAIIEAFLTLLNLENDDTLRAELFDKVNHVKNP